MMSSAQNNPPAGKNGPQTATAISGCLKTPSAIAAARAYQPHFQEPAPVNCPRCDSPHTKFCYYNNYSLAQPRHFCKTCRRYWTKGGALRKVPVGGGSRKNKKTAASFSSPSATDHHTSGGADGLRFFQDLSPAMDFQLSHYGALMPPPKTNPTAGFLNQLSSSLGDLSADNGRFIPARNSDSLCDVPFSPPLSGFNYFPFPSKNEGGISTKSPLGFQDVGPSLLSSIESLSYINQDLHWKLQQQRLGLMFVAEYNKDSNNNNNNNNNNNDKDSSLVPSSSAAGVQNLVQRRRQPILYQNTEISSADESCTVIEAFSSKDDGINEDLSTEWFLGNDNENSCYTSGGDNNLNNDKSSSRSSNGFQAWNGLGYF